MAYTIDRNEAARRLGVSTRTIDRYIQAERIRTRRVGKKLFLEEDDIETIRAEDIARSEDDYEILETPTITKNTDSNAEILPSQYHNSQDISADAKMAISEFSRIYNDAQDIIAKKDEIIKDLSYKLGKAETALENAINISEHQKTTHLLESANIQHQEENKHFSEKITGLEKEVQKKNSFIIIMIVLLVLTILASGVFLFFNRS